MKSIDVLQISPHYYQYLRGRGINTLDDLVAYGKEKLLKAKNFGENGVKEVERELKTHDLHFKKCSCGTEIDSDQEHCFRCWQSINGPGCF